MHTRECPTCHGDGHCPDCHGHRDFALVCQTCGGSGHCPRCQGAGVIEKDTHEPEEVD